MDPTRAPTDRYRRIDAAFDVVLDLPPDEQMAFLDRTAAGDPELRAELVQLLAAHRRSMGILDTPVGELAPALLDPALLPPAEAPDRIGPWRVVRAIGQGGMGAVFLAERADGQFEQRVAIKLIQYAAPGTVRRFLEERRILALLEHPGIARLIDGGLTSSGRPYFAMEFVEGVSLHQYCDAHDLSLERRLDLLAEVADVVSYAHQHLVIHCDLKPSNILVTSDGRVKLLDFGIARLLSGPAGDEGTENLVMTPEYAAPEQFRGDPVSTATDVYALGVLLYRLVAGVHPYEVGGKSLSELTRIVCEEEPSRPSVRAPDLRRRLSGDLDLIVMTALHKDPARRYQSPVALAEDLRRFRDGRPILARPDTAGYRVRKFVGRHRVGVAAAASLVLLLAAGAGRERVLRHRAEIEAGKAKAVGDYVVSVFDVADPFAAERRDGSEVTARALLDQGVHRVDSTLAGQPEVQAQLRSVFGRAFTSLGLFDRAAPLLKQALAQHQQLYGGDNITVAEDMDRLGDVLAQQDRFDEAEPLLREALAKRRRLLGSSDEATAGSLEHLATLYQRRNDYASAEPLFREAVAIRRRVSGDTTLALAQALTNLGLLLYQKDAYQQAEPVYREALAISVRLQGENHPGTAETMQNLAQTEERLGRDAEAETLYRRALAAKRRTLGNLHPSVTVNLNNLGELLIRQERVDEAEPLIREALALDRQIFGPNHSYVAASLRNLGTVLRFKGEFAEAESHYRAALEIHRTLLGPEHRSIATDLNDIGNVRRLRNDLPGAVDYFRQSVAMAGRLLGSDHVSTLAMTCNLGRALQAQGHQAEAERMLREVANKLDPANPGQRSWYVNAQSGLGLALVAEGRPAEARDLLLPAVELARQQFGEEHVRTADARLALGRALLATGDYAGAEPVLRAAAVVLERKRNSQPYFAADAAEALGELRRRR